MKKPYRITFTVVASVVVDAESDRDAIDRFDGDPDLQADAGIALASAIATHGFKDVSAEPLEDE